jgi:hypothetical protein
VREEDDVAQRLSSFHGWLEKSQLISLELALGIIASALKEAWKEGPGWNWRRSVGKACDRRLGGGAELAVAPICMKIWSGSHKTESRSRSLPDLLQSVVGSTADQSINRGNSEQANQRYSIH